MFPNMWVAEANITQAGVIAPASLASLQALMDSAISGQITAGVPPVLGHSSSEVLPTPFTTVTVQPKVGTMRRRIRGF